MSEVQHGQAGIVLTGRSLVGRNPIALHFHLVVFLEGDVLANAALSHADRDKDVARIIGAAIQRRYLADPHMLMLRTVMGVAVREYLCDDGADMAQRAAA